MTSPLQRKLKISGPTVVTANRLADGAVVWLARAGRWTDRIAEAEVVETSEDALRLMDHAHRDERVAVGAYPAPVRLAADGVPVPANLRERIRASGPSIALPLAPRAVTPLAGIARSAGKAGEVLRALEPAPL